MEVSLNNYPSFIQNAPLRHRTDDDKVYTTELILLQGEVYTCIWH